MMRRATPIPGATTPPPPDCGASTGAAGRSRWRTAAAATGQALSARRWRRLVCAAVSGAILAFTLPPFGVLPALAAWSALLALVAAGEARATRGIVERALLGFAFGFGYHLAGLWWVGAAFLVDAEAFGALLPLGVVGLPLLLAPFHALAVALTGLAPAAFAWRAVALAAAVAGSEWLRGVLFTGFPWNVAGVQLTSVSALAQGASVVGVAGLAPLAVLIGAVPALLMTRSARRVGVPCILGLTAAVALFGAVRMASAPASDPDAPAVRVVQPAVPQNAKWDPTRREAIWARLLRLTAPGGRAGVVIWPETAIPFLWRAPSVQSAELAVALAGRTLVTGAVVMEARGEGARAANSVLVIGPEGSVDQRYDKVRLVPFGEFLPLASLLERMGLTALVQSASPFAAGAGRAPLDLPGLPGALPLICYEVIFPPGHVDPSVGLVVNVTNDAWFGDTPGPRQHFHHTRLRAIEGGLPVVRVANTGISGVIDGVGRVTHRLPLGVQGAFEASVPPPVSAPYARLGDGPLLIILALALGLARCGRSADGDVARQENTFSLFDCNPVEYAHVRLTQAGPVCTCAGASVSGSVLPAMVSETCIWTSVRQWPCANSLTRSIFTWAVGCG